MVLSIQTAAQKPQIISGGGIPAPPVISLFFDAPSSSYRAAFTVGKDNVNAAFDSGSAQFIVATTSCNACSGPTYDPKKSNASSIKDLTGSSNSSCKTTLSYASQSSTVQLFADTLAFARVPEPPCKGSTQQIGQQAVSDLVITDFPVGGILINSGSTAANVLGMSGVMTTTKSSDGSKYLLPTCQYSDTPAFESPVLQSIAEYNKSIGEANLWSVRFAQARSDGASVSFRKNVNSCGIVQYTDAVRVIPDAPSALVGTPWRYYVVKVNAATTYSGESLPNFPQYLLVDTGTSQFLVPGATSADTLQSQGLVLTLDGGVKLTWQTPSGYNNGSVNLFANMGDDLAQAFSTSSNVGIMGNMAMLGRYIEFTLDMPRKIGFA